MISSRSSLLLRSAALQIRPQIAASNRTSPHSGLRFFSADVPAKKSGSGFFQRLSSFLVGAGLTALGTHFFILDEVRKGNMAMIEKQVEIEKRLEKLEKKK